MIEELEAELRRLEKAGLGRAIEPLNGLDFSSNDYLGLARDLNLRDEVVRRLADQPSGLGSAAARLLGGETGEHLALERRLAIFKGSEAALLFSSGYQANVGLLTALIRPQDRVLSDELNHASLIDGLRLCRCEKVIFPHCDAAAVEAELERPHQAGRTFLVTESLFSMDGDVAPLGRYAALCRGAGAELIVDEAHATGLFGLKRGSGLVEEAGIEGEVLASVSTFGKAFGLSGAFVAARQTVIDFLVHRCRGFIFTTALPPMLLTAIGTALERVGEGGARRRRVLELAARLRRALQQAGVEVGGGRGPIVPVVVGSNERTTEVATRLQLEGFEVRAVRPPTVAEGEARLRLCVHADHRERDIDALAGALGLLLGGGGVEAPRRALGGSP